MMTATQQHIVGRVLRASTTGFDCGTRGSKIDELHTFGAFVKVAISEDELGACRRLDLRHPHR